MASEKDIMNVFDSLNKAVDIIHRLDELDGVLDTFHEMYCVCENLKKSNSCNEVEINLDRIMDNLDDAYHTLLIEYDILDETLKGIDNIGICRI